MPRQPVWPEEEALKWLAGVEPRDRQCCGLEYAESFQLDAGLVKQLRLVMLARRPAPSCSSSTACGSTGRIVARFSTAPLGLPGRLTISVRPRMPATARLSMACGVMRRLAARIASARPGASRSITDTRRFRRDVTRRKAGAAGRQHQVQAQSSAQCTRHGGDLRPARRARWPVCTTLGAGQPLRHGLRQGRAAQVRPLAARAAVADGQDATDS